jgi:D-3-phosphoglycerate dehydrogenase
VDEEHIIDKYVDYDELYHRADFISLHAFLNKDSYHLIDDDAIAKMKDGVRIVDAARGGVLEEAALLRALESGKVAGAALDVFEKEPPVAWEAAKHPRVIAVPHIGAQTDEAQLRAAVDISTEVLRALNGEELRWKIV